jgi:hypothetical protein
MKKLLILLAIAITSCTSSLNTEPDYGDLIQYRIRGNAKNVEVIIINSLGFYETNTITLPHEFNCFDYDHSNAYAKATSLDSNHSCVIIDLKYNGRVKLSEVNDGPYCVTEASYTIPKE